MAVRPAATRVRRALTFGIMQGMAPAFIAPGIFVNPVLQRTRAGKPLKFWLLAVNPVSGNAFRKFQLAENQRKDTTPLGLVIIRELTQGSSQARNPGLNDGIPLGFGKGISERHYG